MVVRLGYADRFPVEAWTKIVKTNSFPTDVKARFVGSEKILPQISVSLREHDAEKSDDPSEHWVLGL